MKKIIFILFSLAILIFFEDQILHSQVENSEAISLSQFMANYYPSEETVLQLIRGGVDINAQNEEERPHS